jgi:hypothetical protein
VVCLSTRDYPLTTPATPLKDRTDRSGVLSTSAKQRACWAGSRWRSSMVVLATTSLCTHHQLLWAGVV